MKAKVECTHTHGYRDVMDPQVCARAGSEKQVAQFTKLNSPIFDKFMILGGGEA